MPTTSATPNPPAHPHADAVLSAVAEGMPGTVEDLKSLVKIPGVSAPGYPDAPLMESAKQVADKLTAAGLLDVEVLTHGQAPPFVVGAWRGAPDAPTVLVYGHHDVQPPGNPERWDSPPWQPEERDGRLYGRGVVDDKAGIMAHVAAVRAWLAATGSLPVNLVFIIEGEEEVGSPHLAEFLAAHSERLAADVLILTDTCNLDTGIPALTVSLRGLVMADVTVSVLNGPLHSGIWGGALPDPVQALAKILARLSDDAGRCAIPGIAIDTPPRSDLANLPFNDNKYREQGGVLDGVPLLTEGGAATYHATWDAPTVAVSAIDCVPLAESSNQILPLARARVGVRLAPDQDPQTCLTALTTYLAADTPWGCRVEISPDTAAGGWRTDPQGPLFDAAARALSAGYDYPVAHIGCGGSIPFVEPFARAMGNIPALLLGVEDPPCRAHGENESLSLSDFTKACRAAALLYGEIAAAHTR